MVLQAIVALLTSWGCQVSGASDLTSTRNLLSGPLPDAILVDYQLDDLTGLELLKLLEVPRSMPVVVITANNTESVRQEVEAMGHQFLPKPVRPAVLRALISSLLH